MKRNKSVLIKSKSVNQGSEGGSAISYIGGTPLFCDLQPYSGDLAQKEYGVEINAVQLMISAPQNFIYEGQMVYVTDKEQYLIAYVARWSKHYECILEAYHG